MAVVKSALGQVQYNQYIILETVVYVNTLKNSTYESEFLNTVKPVLRGRPRLEQ